MRFASPVPLSSLLVSALLLWSTTLAGGTRDHKPQTVQVQMHNVALHIDEGTVMSIRRLRGELVSTRPGEPPTFDDKNSFIVRVDGAEIAMTADSLSRLMNDYVFNYDGSPFRNLRITPVGNQLKVEGTLRKGVGVPFTIVADPRVENGSLRLHTVSMKAVGIPAKGLLSFFGLELDRLVSVKQARGVRLDGNDLLLEPSGLVPPPRIEGRLEAVKIENDTIVQVFGPGREPPLHPTDPNAPNYMYYRGGTLRFGKLTMTDTDMELIDQHPADPFDFFQDRYNEQLVAGYSKNTPEHGLKVYMPDYHDLHRGGRP